MDWFRWHHGTVTDPKFMWVARSASVRVSDVIAVWASVLERASVASVRGSIEGFDCSDMDVLFGFTDGDCLRILDAFRSKGMIVDDCVTKWSVRQPLREDSTAAERKRRQRDTSPVNDMSRNVTQCHADEAVVTANHEDVTLRHASSQNVPPRLDKIRLDNIKPISASPSSKRKLPSGDHHLFIAWWTYAFRQVEGYDYAFSPKDASQVKRLLEACKDLKGLVLRACSFLMSEDEWLEDGKRDLSIMLSRISAMPPVQNGQVPAARSIGIYPPEGISFLDWKPWENTDDQP